MQMIAAHKSDMVLENFTVQLQRRNDLVIGANIRPVLRNCTHLVFARR
jgi:hypothetical protein